MAFWAPLSSLRLVSRAAVCLSKACRRASRNSGGSFASIGVLSRSYSPISLGSSKAAAGFFLPSYFLLTPLPPPSSSFLGGNSAFLGGRSAFCALRSGFLFFRSAFFAGGSAFLDGDNHKLPTDKSSTGG